MVCYFYPVAAPYNVTAVTQAIYQVISVLQAGNILLLEEGPSDSTPLESVQIALDAIQLAVGHGIIVIEGVGNGCIDLDAWVDINGVESVEPNQPGFCRLRCDYGWLVLCSCAASVI